MKRYCVLFLLVAISIAAHANILYCDGLYYKNSGATITLADGKTVEAVEVTCQPDGHYSKNTIEIPRAISIGDRYQGTKVYYPYAIDDQAFENCTSVEKVILNDRIEWIGHNAFSGSSIKEITITKAVRLIEDAAFTNCKKLRSIVIDKSNPYFDSRDNCNAIIETASNKLIAGCKNSTIPNTVTAIGNQAFIGCTDLRYITIPNSVTSIGKNAFSGCTLLNKVEIPNSITSIGDCLFRGCKSLASITLPNSITTIGSNAFSDCTSLASITLPNSITTISNSAFSGCTALRAIDIPSSVTALSNSLFNGCTSLATITLPNSLSNIADSVFFNCSGLTGVTIPNSVTSIGHRAFNGCTSLASITLPYSLSNLGYDEFKQCTGLTHVYWNVKSLSYAHSSPFPSTVTDFIFGDGVETIPKKLCSEKYNLTNISIPRSVTSIGEGAFASCSGLTSIKVDAGNPNYDSRDNCNAIIETASNTLIAGCKTTIIPNSVTAIGNDAFHGCTELTDINIPNSVTSIGVWAFYGCTGLTSITIPISVSSIEAFAFSSCNSLKKVTWNARTCIGSPFNDYSPISEFIFGSQVETIPGGLCRRLTMITDITIPNSVTSIGGYAFSECTGLKNVNIGNSVTSIGGNAFERCTNISSIIIPNSTTSIGEQCFWGCSKLKDVTIGESVTEIGKYAFNNCITLNNIDIPNSVTEIGEKAFFKCSNLKNAVIGNSVTKIGTSAFEECTNLRTVTIGESLSEIGRWAFALCDSLYHVTWNAKSCGTYINFGPTTPFDRHLKEFIIGEKVQKLPEGLCMLQSQLSNITIPSSVKEIGKNAFAECTGLKRIDAYPDPSKVTMGDEVFVNVPKYQTLHVPSQYYRLYQTTAQWKEFLNIAPDLETDGIEEVHIDEIDSNRPIEVFNLRGVMLGTSLDNLQTGIYIVRQGNKVAKVVR